ncbi:MAG: HAD-IIB family hydrolase [Acidobacteriia bacterium]|nr:HAD-IIB family hydrolase [Terriglobia bacterium]
MIILFTDLDGTLLDESAYSADAAREALRWVDELGLPLVFCTSKTRAEVEYWRSTLRNPHPFIVENGGALYVPDGYFPPRFGAPDQRDTYGIFEFGIPYDDLVETLRQASRETGCRVRCFRDMSANEIGRKYGLSLEQARLAKIREYDEPFEILDPPGDELLEAIKCRGKNWTRGGRLYHIMGHGNKAHGVCLLTYYYRSTFETIITVGLGDGMNDLGFLRCVDIPVIIKSKAAGKLKSALPRARVTDQAGPEGWSQAVLDVLDKHAAPTETASNEMTGKVGPFAFHRCFQTASSGLSGISDSLPSR